MTLSMRMLATRRITTILTFWLTDNERDWFRANCSLISRLYVNKFHRRERFQFPRIVTIQNIHIRSIKAFFLFINIFLWQILHVWSLIISQYRINELISIKSLFVALNLSLTEFDYSRNSARMMHDANNTITGLISLLQRAVKKVTPRHFTLRRYEKSDTWRINILIYFRPRYEQETIFLPHRKDRNSFSIHVEPETWNVTLAD